MKLFAFAFVLLLCVSLVGCGMYVDIHMGNHIIGDTYENADQYTAGDFTYNAADVDTIEVNWRVGKVTLAESNAATLSVSESGKNLELDAQVQHWLENRTLHVQFCASGARFAVDGQDKYLTLELPKNIALAVQCTSADIYADTLEQKSVLLSSVSGEINVGTVTADTVDLSSNSGWQSIDSVTANGLVMSSVSGALSVGEVSVSGPVSCDTTSGEVCFERLESMTAEIGTVSGHVDLGVLRCPSTQVSTTSGGVSLTLPTDTGAAVEYHSTSGDLHTSIPWTAAGDLRVFGDGAYSVTVGTVSGDLEIAEK